jgi:hypothetical protein
MRCPECGSEVGPEERFCGNCGAPVEGDVPEPESAGPEGAEPEGVESAPPEETMLVEGPALLEDEVNVSEEGAPDEDRELVPSPPPAPSMEDVVPLPEEEGTVPPPEEELRPPAATYEPAPPSPAPPRGQSSKRIWIIVAVVVAVLILCCCALVVGSLLLTQIDSTSVVLPHVPSLPV